MSAWVLVGAHVVRCYMSVKDGMYVMNWNLKWTEGGVRRECAGNVREDKRGTRRKRPGTEQERREQGGARQGSRKGGSDRRAAELCCARVEGEPPAGSGVGVPRRGVPA